MRLSSSVCARDLIDRTNVTGNAAMPRQFPDLETATTSALGATAVVALLESHLFAPLQGAIEALEHGERYLGDRRALQRRVERVNVALRTMFFAPSTSASRSSSSSSHPDAICSNVARHHWSCGRLDAASSVSVAASGIAGVCRDVAAATPASTLTCTSARQRSARCWRERVSPSNSALCRDRRQ